MLFEDMQKSTALSWVFSAVSAAANSRMRTAIRAASIFSRTSRFHSPYATSSMRLSASRCPMARETGMLIV
ncbi:hypothetical protein, partial [Paraburkholderia graminis]|uniref:hypothetical protein n=1 Tax=Paraburkholderia graminis TaxID=60548 RepID=UPI0038BC14BB